MLAVLRQRRVVADQAGLSARQRLANVAGALEVPGGAGGCWRGGQAVLVDDLMTTGASLAEAARAVAAARWPGRAGRRWWRHPGGAFAVEARTDGANITRRSR